MRLRMAGNLFETSGQRAPCIWRAKAPQTRLNARSGQRVLRRGAGAIFGQPGLLSILKPPTRGIRSSDQG